MKLLSKPFARAAATISVVLAMAGTVTSASPNNYWDLFSTPNDGLKVTLGSSEYSIFSSTAKRLLAYNSRDVPAFQYLKRLNSISGGPFASPGAKARGFGTSAATGLGTDTDDSTVGFGPFSRYNSESAFPGLSPFAVRQALIRDNGSGASDAPQALVSGDGSGASGAPGDSILSTEVAAISPIATFESVDAAIPFGAPTLPELLPEDPLAIPDGTTAQPQPAPKDDEVPLVVPVADVADPFDGTDLILPVAFLAPDGIIAANGPAIIPEPGSMIALGLFAFGGVLIRTRRP